MSWIYGWLSWFDGIYPQKWHCLRKYVTGLIPKKEVCFVNVTDCKYIQGSAKRWAGPRLHEFVPRGQREPGGGIHATYVPPVSRSLYTYTRVVPIKSLDR